MTWDIRWDSFLKCIGLLTEVLMLNLVSVTILLRPASCIRQPNSMRLWRCVPSIWWCLVQWLPVSLVSTFIGTRCQMRDTIAGSSCPTWPKSWSSTPALRVSLWFFMSVMLMKRRPASASPHCAWPPLIIFTRFISTALLVLRRRFCFGLAIIEISSLGLAESSFLPSSMCWIFP